MRPGILKNIGEKGVRSQHCLTLVSQIPGLNCYNDFQALNIILKFQLEFKIQLNIYKNLLVVSRIGRFVKCFD